MLTMEEVVIINKQIMFLSRKNLNADRGLCGAGFFRFTLRLFTSF